MPENQVPNTKSVNDLLKQYQQLLGGRKNFESYWQSLHDYFYIEANDVNASYAPGSELNATYLWDSTTLDSADVLASGFMNYLTPTTSLWFKLRHKDPKMVGNKKVNNYLGQVEEEVYHTLNNSNFNDQMISSYKGSGVYGTSVLLEEDDLEDTVRFYNIPVKSIVLVEDGKGRVVEYYLEFEYTAFQALTRWGKEKLSKEMNEEVEKGSTEKHKFLLYIARRNVRDISKSDKENMPIKAEWIDVKGKKIIDTGGYNEFPAMAHRFMKRSFIPWGFSPAMKALPFARILNAIAKTTLRSAMKETDPPIAVPNNAFIMPFNSNPRAINYYNKSVMNNAQDMFSFSNFGKSDKGLQMVDYYSQKVEKIMYNDIFLAFQGLTKQMNNPEVMERINEKMSMLGPAVGRYTGEVLNPIIIRTIGILARAGKLPKAPDEMILNPMYEIDYVSSLAQAQKRSQLNALMSALSVTGQMAQFQPEVLDKVSPDSAIETVWDVTGAPAKVLRDDKEVEEIRANRAQMQAKEQELAMVGSAAMTGKDAAQADKLAAEAKVVGKK